MTRDGAVPVTLPQGLLEGGVRRRDAIVRPLSGREEESLVAGQGRPRAWRVTELLARCVERLGDVRPGADGMRSLSVGDREALLLHLRRITLGDRIDCVLTCPEPSCGERLDVALRTDDLLLPPYPDHPEWHEMSIPSEGGDVRLRFRLPTGGDQEAVAVLASRDPVEAARRLLDGCVAPAEDGEAAPALGAAAATALGERMAELDPQAELRIDLRCAACGSAMETLLDVATYFLAELAASTPRLYEDVHTLATWYHWSEASILGLSVPRRRRYLDLIAARASEPTAWATA